ncbi:MAG: thioredoxin [Bacteroidales bacterium]|jgi:thioredoxin 1|nr:thioredoxin [Bacteroidales bacterium]
MKIFHALLLLSFILSPLTISSGINNDNQNVVNNVLILNDDNFEKTIKNGIVLVDFWAVWCGPCRLMAPILEEIALEMKGKAVIGKLDTDKNLITSLKYNIKYLPTVIIFKNGNPEYLYTGVQSKETLVTAINLLQ